MDKSRLFSEIESTSFFVRVNVANRIETVIEAIYSEPVALELISAVVASREDRIEVLNRIGDLAHLEVDRRYSNPWDAALATYVWALGLSDSELGFIAARLADQVINGWWAKRVARRFLDRFPYNRVVQTTPLSTVMNVEMASLGSVINISVADAVVISEKAINVGAGEEQVAPAIGYTKFVATAVVGLSTPSDTQYQKAA